MADGMGVAAWVAESLARDKRRGEADAGLIGTAGPRDPADDWPGEAQLGQEASQAATVARLAAWA